MATAEDVFALYERKSSYYHDCNKQDNMNECKNVWLNKCHCILNQVVKPFTIGNQDVKCSFSRKCYIKYGEECPICLNCINKKSEAFLTPCGHSFHKKCIFTSFKSKCLENYYKQFRCPICRGNIGLQIEEINERYKFNLSGLDDLENFWIKTDFIVPRICSQKWNHYIGTRKECSGCIKYIETGY